MNEEKKAIKNDKIICLIDNYQLNFPTDRIERIKDIIKGNLLSVDLKTLHYSKLDISHLKGISGFILSGSNFNVSEYYINKNLRKKFKPEIQLIQKKNQKPILAICFGLHLIAYAFKGKILRMNIPDSGSQIISISLKKSDELIPYDEIPVNIHHRDYLLPDDPHIRSTFQIIATKEIDGYKTVQYMRHLKRPIFSIQFHPETHYSNNIFAKIYDKGIINKTKTIGEEIIKNFLNQCL